MVTGMGTTQLEIGTEGRLGVIALNRPEAINALSLAMIEGITAQLEAWRHDPAIRAVLFEGRGPKGFCAGGDVRYVREQVIGGRLDVADGYFAAEYRMNGLIATYPKPVISLTTGIVMGGGIGVAGHAAFRFTTAEAAYAMPEANIGFVCDVGVNWILSKAPEERALLFLMSGQPVTGADVLALGLADCCLDTSRLAEVRRGIVGAANTGNVEPALVALMQGESVQAGERAMCTVADRYAEALDGDTAAEIVAGFAEDAMPGSPAASYAAAFARLSPTSLELILRSHRAARRLRDVRAVLDLDLRMAAFCARHPDFAEGVRAQLVDKDHRPKWSPASLAEVDHAALERAVNRAEPALPR
jgi:enoyl-CoA hydratase